MRPKNGAEEWRLSPTLPRYRNQHVLLGTGLVDAVLRRRMK